jgi:MoxR-like ATPase
MDTDDKLTARLGAISQFRDTMMKTVGGYVVGNTDLLELVLIALLSEGHILIEGTPGTAKTTLAKTVARATGCAFSRIQGAIDLQPADMVGVRIFEQSTRTFVLRPGPVFTNILLADEINRINPKSQSAFLEAMSEQQVTIDGETCMLPTPFLVIATQNPFEQQGTYPLIEAQRDRFMFGLQTGHLGPVDELDLVQRESSGRLNWNKFSASLDHGITREELLGLIRMVSTIHIGIPVMSYIRDIVVATRENGNIELGASSRASIAFVRGSRARAAIAGRAYVLPDDVKMLAHEILSHRILLTREVEIDGRKPTDIIDEILETVEVP